MSKKRLSVKQKRIRRAKRIQSIIGGVGTLLVTAGSLLVLGVAGASDAETATPLTWKLFPVSILLIILGILCFGFLSWVNDSRDEIDEAFNRIGYHKDTLNSTKSHITYVETYISNGKENLHKITFTRNESAGFTCLSYDSETGIGFALTEEEIGLCERAIKSFNKRYWIQKRKYK